MAESSHLHPAERLLVLRQTLGLSQRELAKEFQVSSGAIASWETGTRIIPGPVLKLITLYEKALPTLVIGHHSETKPADFLAALKSSFSINNNDEELRLLNEIQESLHVYLNDTSALDSLGGKIKLIMIQRLLRSLKTSKGVSAKIAQLASFLEMGLPVEVRLALGTLQSRAQANKPKITRDTIEAAFGKPLKKVFSVWHEEPLAVTSLGQVHYAKLITGQEVAVKVQHPHIRNILEKQLRSIELLQSLASFFGDRDKEISEEIRRSLFQECDYLLEAQNQERFRNILSDDPRVIVPRVYREWTTENVLVSEYIKAESFQSFITRATQDQRNTAAEIIMGSLPKAAFVYCCVHTDLHPGNFLFTNGKVVFLDFGRVIDCAEDRMRIERQFYLAMLNKEQEKARILAQKVGFAKEINDFDFDAFWSYLQTANAHLMTDSRFKFTREYSQSLVREGRVYSKKHQLKLSKDSFWAFVFNSSTWGIMADLNCDINFRRIALHSLELASALK